MYCCCIGELGADSVPMGLNKELCSCPGNSRNGAHVELASIIGVILEQVQRLDYDQCVCGMVHHIVSDLEW